MLVQTETQLASCLRKPLFFPVIAVGSILCDPLLDLCQRRAFLSVPGRSPDFSAVGAGGKDVVESFTLCRLGNTLLLNESVLSARPQKNAAICIYKLERGIGEEMIPWLVLFRSI